jgi:hypothetical protein
MLRETTLACREKLTPPRLHGQCPEIGKTRIIVKIVRLFSFSESQQRKACQSTKNLSSLTTQPQHEASEPVRNFLLHPLDRPTDRPALWTSKPKLVMQCKRYTTTIRTYLVRILHPLLQNHMFSLEKRGFGDDSGDSLARLTEMFVGGKAAQDDDFYRGSTCRHGHAWIGTESQSKWPEMRKTLGKPGE